MEYVELKSSNGFEHLSREEALLLLQQQATELDTKQKQLNRAKHKLNTIVQQQHLQLDTLFETIIDPYVLIDLRGNVIRMNEAAQHFFGQPTLQVSFNVLRSIHPDDVPFAVKTFEKFKRKGKLKNFRARVYNYKKELRWIDLNSNILYDDDGQATLAQGIIRDITPSMKQQYLIQEQRDHLNAIVENSSLGIVLTQDDRIIQTNKAFEKLLGYSKAVLSELTLSELVIEEDASNHYQTQLLNLGAIDQSTQLQRYRTSSGKSLWTKTNRSIVKNNYQKEHFQVSVIEDITEELQNQNLLKALNTLMRSILGKTNIYEIAWEITTNTTELLGFEDFVIYLVDQEKGTLKQIAAYGEKLSDVRTIANELEIPIGNGIVGSVAKSGTPEIIADTTLDSRYIVDDKIRYSEIAVPIIADGTVIGIIDSEHPAKDYFNAYHLKTLETIASLAATQLKSALNIALRKEADEKNRALLEDLTKSNKELKDFAHIVSHDLKSPLRSINALAHWIQEENEGNPNEQISEHSALLVAQADKMDQLISGILQYASIDQINTQSRNIHLDKLVREVIKTAYVPDHINIEIKSQLPQVKLDRFRLHQLFQNLLSNAIKYCDKQEGKVEIDCQDMGAHWQFSIADNGIGIAPKYHKKIFEIFQQLENHKDSTGVGLSIVKKIIDRYQGKIWLDSTPQQGTTFYFTLPKQ